jgi:RNA polymerase sigma-70 factor (sigma-E family)
VDGGGGEADPDGSADPDEPADLDEREAGADAAVTALFDAGYTRMLRVAAVLLGDVSTAEDVVQEAFLNLHRSWHRVRDRSDAAGYLHRSVVNAARSRLRRRDVARRLHLVQRADAPVHAASAEAVALASLADQPLVAALRALPRREREVVLFRHYLDLSERQTAEALGLRVGSVKAYGSRGLATLRSSLQPGDTHPLDQVESGS